MFGLAGKRAVVTGASRGIGQYAAIALARAGADVAGTYFTDAEGGASTRKAIEDLGRRALILHGDVARSETHQLLIDAVTKEWGGVDIWINNAARLLVRPVLDMTDEARP